MVKPEIKVRIPKILRNNNGEISGILFSIITTSKKYNSILELLLAYSDLDKKLVKYPAYVRAFYVKDKKALPVIEREMLVKINHSNNITNPKDLSTLIKENYNDSINESLKRLEDILVKISYMDEKVNKIYSKMFKPINSARVALGTLSYLFLGYGISFNNSSYIITGVSFFVFSKILEDILGSNQLYNIIQELFAEYYSRPLARELDNISRIFGEVVGVIKSQENKVGGSSTDLKN